jgi:CheY-like chemotaxis protein
MKILLVGCAREAAAMLQALLRDQRHEITHCAEGDRAIAELRQRGRLYDWAIVNGRAMTGGEKDLARVLRTMGSFTATESPAIQAPGALVAAPAGACGVEWTRGGVLQLHCALHSLSREARPAAAPGQECLAGGFTFEYHAPCSKERKGND